MKKTWLNNLKQDLDEEVVMKTKFYFLIKIILVNARYVEIKLEKNLIDGMEITDIMNNCNRRSQCRNSKSFYKDQCQK